MSQDRNAFIKQAIKAFAYIVIFCAFGVGISYLPFENTAVTIKADFIKPLVFDQDVSILFEGHKERHSLPETFDLSKEGRMTVFLDIRSINNLESLTLDLNSGYNAVKVYLDDYLLFDFTPTAPRHLTSEGYLIHYIDLFGENIPSKADLIKIEYTLMPGGLNKHRVEKYYIGSRISLLNNDIRQEIPHLLMGLTMLTMAFFLMVVNFFIHRKHLFDQKLLHLSSLACFVGMYILFQTKTLRYFLPYTSFLYIVEYFNLAMMPIPVMIISLDYTDKKFIKPFYLMIALLSLNLLMQVLALFFSLSEPRYLLFITHILLSMSSLLVIASFFMTDKKKYPQKKELQSSILPLALSLFAGLVSYIVFHSTSYVTILMIGSSFFIVFQVTFIVKKYDSISKKVLMDDFYEKIAMEDNLTGLGSRLAYNKQLEWIEENKNALERMLILTFDLNGLKQTNDTMGHIAGDHLLQFFSDCLKTLSTKYQAKVFRIGGDEFTVFIFNQPLDVGETFISLLKHSVKSYEVPGIVVDFASGLEEVVFDKYTNLYESLANSDRKMYEDKANNKNSRHRQ